MRTGGTLSDEPLVFRPSRWMAATLSVLFLSTAVVLVWLGGVLTPADVEATDGLSRILFTAVPIRVFAWCAAVVFAFLGMRVATKGLLAGPSLVLSSDGLSIGGGAVRPWSDVQAVSHPSDDRLRIEFAPSSDSTNEPERIELSQCDLGADLRSVSASIDAHCARITGRARLR